ncbi:hypothetical protein C3L33_11081, partial [Rhododendron williamsianum]
MKPRVSALTFGLRTPLTLQLDAIMQGTFAHGDKLESFPLFVAVPIQVNKNLAFTDGMRVIESAKVSMHTSSSDGLLFTEMDQPSSQPCIETEEFNLLQKMLNAVGEERYKDAGILFL